MIEIIILFMLVLITMGIGNRILPFFKVSWESVLEEQIVCIGLGFSALIIATYLLAAFHVLHLLSIVAILMVGFIIGRKPLVQAIHRLILGIDLGKIRFDAITTAMIVVIVIMGFFNILGALAPATDTDGLAYHLAVPKFYLQHGGFVYNPIQVFNWPLTIEMLYTIAIAISTDSLAKLIHLTFGIMSAFAVYFLAKEWFGKKPASISAILFYGMPLVAIESGIAYVDLGTTYFTITGLLLFMRWYLKDSGTLLLSAIFIGISASTKWNGPVLILILLIFCMHRFLDKFFDKFFESPSPTLSPIPSSQETCPPQSRRWHSPLGVLIILFILISSAFTFLWYGKNLVLTGNPVAPFLANIFNTKDWTYSHSQAYQASVGSLYRSPFHFLFIPFALTFHGTPFGEITYLGPWLLMLLPLAFFLKKWPRPVWFIYLFSLLYYIAWFLTSQQSRLLLPILAALCAISGWAVYHDSLAPVQRFLTWTILLSLILALPFTLLYNGKGGLAGIGMESRSAYLERLLPDFATIQFANTNLSSHAKLFLVRENNAFLLEREYLWGDAAMQGIIDIKNADPQQLLLQLKNAGVTHLMVNRAIHCDDPANQERHCPDIKGLLSSPTTKDHVFLIFEKNNAALYELI